MKLVIEDVADYLEGFHKYDGYAVAKCVFHGPDNNPSLMIWDDGYKCMSCDAVGTIEKLYHEVSGRIVIRERKYSPAQRIWYRWEEKFGSVQNTAKIAHRELTQNPELGHYLKQRGIDSQIKSGRLGFLDGFYTFPVQDEYGDVQGLIARASPTIQTKELRYTASKDCPTKLYVPNWRKVLKDEYLYLCYGTLDSWTLFMAGYAGITGISGQELNSNNLARFRKPIYIIPDRGEEKNAIQLQTSLGWRGNPLFLDWPEDCKDLNDIHMKYGTEKVIELIEKKKEKYHHVRN